MERRKKNEAFFGKDGITSTSANYVANIAKEMIRKEQNEIDNIDFLSTTVTVVGSDVSHTTKKGDTEEMVLSLPKKLQRIAKMKSLIAWLREAIKEKDELIAEVENKKNEDILKILGIEKNEYPKYQEQYTEKEFIATLSEEEQRKILLLNTKAAIYGKYIHENGAFGKARKRLLDNSHTPSDVQKSMTNIIIAENSPSVDSEKVEATYFELQNQYREAQKELNTHMFKVKSEMHKANMAIIADSKEQQKLFMEKEKANGLAISEWKAKETKKIADYKIVIPAELKELYDEVNAM